MYNACIYIYISLLSRISYSQGEIFMIILYANSRILSRSVDSRESNRRSVSSVTRYSLERMLRDLGV